MTHGITPDSVKKKLSNSVKEYYKRLSPEQRQLLCERLTKIGFKKGRIISPKARAHLSFIHKGKKKNHIYTPEQRRRRSLNQTQRILQGKAVTPAWKTVRRGYYQSTKCRMPIRYDSGFELKYLENLDTLPNVLSFERCRFYLEYETNGIVHHYIPDFKVTFDSHTTIAEVKPKGRFSKIFKEGGKLNSLIRFCEGNGYDWFVYEGGKL